MDVRGFPEPNIPGLQDFRPVRSEIAVTSLDDKCPKPRGVAVHVSLVVTSNPVVNPDAVTEQHENPSEHVGALGPSERSVPFQQKPIAPLEGRRYRRLHKCTISSGIVERDGRG